MIETAAYELIEREGFKRGIEKGKREGMLEEARKLVLKGFWKGSNLFQGMWRKRSGPLIQGFR